jgi:hypothetical protein
MVSALRVGLDSQWTLMWDRRLPGWKTPVTLVVGPPGAWALWSAPPGTGPGAAQPLADHFHALLPGWTVDSYVVVAGAAGIWPRFVTELAIHPAVTLSPGDRRRLVDYLEAATAPDVTGVPAVWPQAAPAPARQRS